MGYRSSGRHCKHDRELYHLRSKKLVSSSSISHQPMATGGSQTCYAHSKLRMQRQSLSIRVLAVRILGQGMEWCVMAEMGRTTGASATRGVYQVSHGTDAWNRNHFKERISDYLWSISSNEEMKENAKEYLTVEEYAPRKEKIWKTHSSR